MYDFQRLQKCVSTLRDSSKNTIYIYIIIIINIDIMNISKSYNSKYKNTILWESA